MNDLSDSSATPTLKIFCKNSFVRFVRSLRSLEESAERASREMDIRNQLKEWDKEFPYLGHELIVRYAAGCAAALVLTSIYDYIRGSARSRNRRY
jgi:hypothetical protein